jgi:hypothetical protein
MRDEIKYEIIAEPDDAPFEGNCSAIDDGSDRETEDWIRDQLECGNLWAWCVLKIRATIEIEGTEYTAESDPIGGCSYESEKAFATAGEDEGEYSIMQAEARESLLNAIPLRISIHTRDDDPWIVDVDCDYPDLARRDGGSVSWEFPREGGCYGTLTNDVGLVADLEAEGYIVELDGGGYDEPGEE